MHWGYWHITCLILIPGVLLASWIDWKARKVPNWLNAALALVGFLAQYHFNGIAGVTTGAWGLLVGLGLLIVPWAMHGMGAGDVKLMAAIGVWFGPMMTLIAFCVGAIIGGVMAVIMILSTGRLYSAMTNLQTILMKVGSTRTIFSDFGAARSFGDSSQLLPYGVPLTAGSLVILLGQCVGWWAL